MISSRSWTDQPLLLPQWIMIPMIGFGMGFVQGAAFEGGAVQSYSSSSNVVIGFCEATVAGIVCAAKGASPKNIARVEAMIADVSRGEW